MPPAAHQAEGLDDESQILEREEVKLDQSDLLDSLHRVLRNRHRAVCAFLVGVERNDLGQRDIGDDHTGGMARRVAQQPFELESVFEKVGMALALVLEPRLHLERLDQRKIAALLGRGVELDDSVGLGK